MKNLTPTQFLMYATALTIGAALALPSILWLRPVGILLLCVAGAAVRVEEQVRRRVGTLVGGMALTMAAVVVGALQPQATTGAYRPRGWYAAVVVTTWAIALVVEHRQWRRIARIERPIA